VFKKKQYECYLVSIFILFFLPFNIYASEKYIKFDPRISEFILKNTSSLTYQIKNNHGLGYQSLKHQIRASGCNSSFLLTSSLLENKNPYLFNKYFQEELLSCNKNIQRIMNIKNLLNDKEIYLVIAGESLKSPMSYLGHSLILFLDRENFYFSPVISFAAPTENLSPLQQITEGGFSFIKAEINAVPLHQVIDYYSNKESRELKFIKLSNTIFNKSQLINHLNEMQSKNLTYNFFTKNCSTYLYSALNKACNCFKPSPSIVTPYLLEKTVLEQEELPEVFVIDSLFGHFNKKYSALNSKNKELTKTMFLSKENSYSNNVEAGEVAAIASRLSFESYQRPNDSYKSLVDLFGEDSSLLRRIPFKNDLMKNSKLFDEINSSSLNFNAQNNKVAIRLSFVDFDHFEQRSQKSASSKLSAGSIELSKSESSARIESINLLDIQSITPINFVTKTPSWRLKLGVNRNSMDQLQPLLSIGSGPAFSLSNFKFYILPSIELNTSFSVPFYSGIQINSDLISIKYETRNAQDHNLTFFKRKSRILGYAYSLIKENQEDIKQQISLSYYF
jgi:hypothetical protein